jgi:POT family proton-dependent oligopeptide transporter
MFKGHPKGLYALALANTGERFGYYTMLAIFVLFLQAKFGFTAAQAGQFYGFFLAGVYFMPLIGGILADKFGYGKMVTLGIVVMFLGYLLMAVPTQGSVALISLIGALVLICVGTGLFKGNLQVMVGNLYDDPRYSAKRDSAFSIFYMAINIGAMYAPSAATAIANWQLKKNGFFYDANIPSLANEFLKNPDATGDMASKLEVLANAQGWTGNIADFASSYINSLAGSYHMGFAVACFSLIVSFAIYLGFKKSFKHADVTSKQQAAVAAAKGEKVVELTKEQTKQRITALILVFVVVIFFWMSFHQNGLTLTWFARDYTSNAAEGLTRIGFSLPMMTCIVIAMYSLFSTIQSTAKKTKLISGGVLALMVILCIVFYTNLQPSTHIEPQLFQQFNPFFVVLLTPISVALFGALAKKGKEPSTPKKIGLGMLIAACGFLVMALASRGLANPTQINGTSDILVSPNWLISTYLVLTFGELLLSPMGISFVSKVAPPKYKGMMMGFWFAATAVGNYLTSVIANIWESGMALWMIWGVLIVVCVISAIFIFSILKRLEKATADC